MTDPSGLRWIFRVPRRGPRRIRADIDEEIAYHLDRRTEELVTEHGMDPERARERAEREFGDIEETKRALRERDRRMERRTRRRNWLDDLRKDAVFAVRTLRKRPGFTAAAVLTLALGIGGTTVMFGALDAMFLRPPSGVQAPDRVHRLYVVRDEGNIRTAPTGGGASYIDYRTLVDGVRGVDGIAGYLWPTMTDYGLGADAQRVRTRAVSSAYFSVLGVRAAVGRLFAPADEEGGGAGHIAVLGHGFWQREFGGDPDVVGRSVLLDGEPHTVVGVAERAFATIDWDPIDVWIPLHTAAEGWREQVFTARIRFLFRRSADATVERVTSSGAAALAAAATEYPDRLDPEPEMVAAPLNALRGANAPQVARIAIWVGAATLLVLLIACANVANLLLARARSRRREMAMRLAMGASRGRIARQLLTESMLLALVGGLFGVAIAAAGGGLIRQFPVAPSAGQLDGRLLAFALTASLATGLLFGLAPVFDAARTGLAGGLREARPGARPSRGRLRSGLVAGQVALSLLLLVGAGLFIRSLRAVTTIDPGMDVDRVATVSVDLGSAGYADERASALYDRALERLRALPGVEAAAAAVPAPLSGAVWSGPFGGEAVETDPPDVSPHFNIVDAGYFETAGTRILRGREFTRGDVAGAEPVMVVNESLARALAPSGAAEGMCVPIAGQLREGGCTRIVGVAEDVRRIYLNPEATPALYRPRAQAPAGQSPFGFRGMILLVRTTGDPGDILADVRRAMQQVAPNMPFVEVQRFETRLDPVVRPFRLGASLFTAFGLLALLLAAVGLYGVIANLVAERTHEVGVRMSLGAARREVVGLVVRQGMRPVLLGLVIGVAAALAGARLLESMLHGVPARDPLTIGIVAVTLPLVAAVASWLPARRAARVDPVIALRAE